MSSLSLSLSLLHSHLTGELKKLTNLVVDAKEKGINVVSALVKRMLEKKMFLFGSVEMNEGSVTETVNQLTELQNARIQVAYDKYVATYYLYFMFFLLNILHVISHNLNILLLPAFLLTNRLFANTRIEHFLRLDLVNIMVLYEIHLYIFTLLEQTHDQGCQLFGFHYNDIIGEKYIIFLSDYSVSL